MKTTEAPKKQAVQIPQTSEKAQKLIQQKEAVTLVTVKAKADTAVKEPKKVKAPIESMEALAVRLIKEKATAETVKLAFITAYKLKGKTDIKFIEPRITIYLKIANKQLAKTV